MPRLVATAPAGGGLRRACQARLPNTTSASTAIVAAQDPTQPMWSAITIGANDGKLSTSSNCQA